MRTLTWVSPLGHIKTVTIGGRRRKPVSSAGTTSLDSLEHFLELQRARVAARLQRMYETYQERQLDGMTRHQALVETTVETRR